MLYFDYNATTPVDEEVLNTMLPYFSVKFGNAASKTHSFGWGADQAVEHSRKQVAELIGAVESEIIFTSGATESINLGIKGLYELYNSSFSSLKKNHIITVATEHKAVLDTCDYLKGLGAQLSFLEVDEFGRIDLKSLTNLIKRETLLVCVMHANNETGVIQDIASIGAICKEYKVMFFSDITQAVGKIPVNVIEHNIDIAAFSAHKYYGPKGVGALYVRRKSPRINLLAQIHGGGHERGYRSGTLNVPGIVGMGKASELVNSEQYAMDLSRISRLRDQLERELLSLTHTVINGSRQHRVPNVINISFEGYKAERLIGMLQHKIAFSVGSACTSAQQGASHVLKAMNLNTDRINSAVRLSLGKYLQHQDIEHCAEWIKSAINKMN